MNGQGNNLNEHQFSRSNIEMPVIPPSPPLITIPTNHQVNNGISRSESNITDSVIDTSVDYRRRTNTYSGSNATTLDLPPSYDDVIANSDVYKVTTDSIENLDT